MSSENRGSTKSEGGISDMDRQEADTKHEVRIHINNFILRR